MLDLETKLSLSADVRKSPNLADRFTPEERAKIGEWVWQGYQQDEGSRQAWLLRNEKALNLAMQTVEGKTFPWPNCSNIAFPLVTIGALQFHARAYPATTQVPNLVRYRVMGPDAKPEDFDRAERISRHMSYQLLEEDTAWEEQHDRLLIVIPIAGCAFKKSYFNPVLGTNVSELVLPQDLVMNYYAKSVETCPRKTHIIPLFRNEIFSNVAAGMFSDVTQEAWFSQPARPLRTLGDEKADRRSGETPPAQADETTPFTTLEQHVQCDLDKDGYAEPYIITIEASSRALLRIVAGWDTEEAVKLTASGSLHSVRATEYFTKYSFIPSPDGSVYDLGFGPLLGPLNESVNTLINQLTDAGTMANTAGGFLGRGVRMRGGMKSFAPLEWKTVDMTGDDLRKNVYPLPVRDPSAVLFQLLSLIINYANRISGATDPMVGENPGQNTPAANLQEMVAQGQKIYSAIFKRLWRAMKAEFKKLYLLNGIFLPTTQSYGPSAQRILRDDYAGAVSRLVPAVDPNVVSDQQRLQRALAVKQASATTPGYDLRRVEYQYLQALQVDSIESVYPGPDKVPPLPNPKLVVEQMKLEVKRADLKSREQQFMLSLLEDRRLNQAKIVQLEAQAAKFLAEAGGVQHGHQIAAFEASLGALKAHDEALRGRIELMQKEMERQDNDNGTGLQSMAGTSNYQGPSQVV